MSEATMRESIEALRKYTPQLNELTDRANRTVQAVEQTLTELSVGIPIEIEFDNGCSLVYDRFDTGQFRIYVVEPGDNYDQKQFNLWSSLPREKKMASVRVLPELLRRLASTVQQQTEENKSLYEEVTEILETLGNSQPTKTSTTKGGKNSGAGKSKSVIPDAYAGDDSRVAPMPTGGNEEIPF